MLPAMRAGSPLESIARDLRYGARTLLGNPGFAAVATITLALGIGANTTIFSAINALALRPLRLERPDRLVRISEIRTDRQGTRNPTLASSTEWKARTRMFQAIERGDFSGGPANLTGIGRAERISLAYSTPGYLAMLGAKAARGRTFLPEDASLGESDTALISAELWQRSFGADPAIVGRKVSVEGQPKTIIGVLPPGFSITPWQMRVDLWLAYDAAGLPRERWMPVIGRLKPGIGIEQAASELNALAHAQPGWNPQWNVVVEDFHRTLVGDDTQFLWTLAAAVGFVLLIACANVANLLLARAAARRKEIAIRVSLGAGRGRLVRQLLAESTLVALAGGALGVVVGLLGNRLFLAFSPIGPAGTLDMSLDYRVLGFTLALSFLTGMLFGLAPALPASRSDLHATLKEGGRESSAESSHGGQAVLLVFETALAMVLLVGAGSLMLRFLRLGRVEPGFNPTRVLRADVLLAGSNYVRPVGGAMKSVTPQGALFFQQVMERLQSIPGVLSVGISRTVPPGFPQQRWFRVLGRPAPPPAQEPFAGFDEVGGAFFQTLEIPLRRGRYVNERDTESSPWVVNINVAMAKRFFPAEDPIGKMLIVRVPSDTSGPEEGRPREIVGVVGDVRDLHSGFAFPVMYGGYRQHATTFYGGWYTSHLWKAFLVKTAGDPLAVVPAVRKAVAEVDKDQPLFGVETIEQRLAALRFSQGFPLRLFGTFAAIALALAAIGIYGVTSYLVARRTHEIGIRVALGASRGDVLRMVIGRGMAMVFIGLAAGIVGSLLLAKVAGRVLFGLRAADPLAYTVVSLVLMAVALAACWLPARRALRVDPVVALRNE